MPGTQSSHPGVRWGGEIPATAAWLPSTLATAQPAPSLRKNPNERAGADSSLWARPPGESPGVRTVWGGRARRFLNDAGAVCGAGERRQCEYDGVRPVAVGLFASSVEGGAYW